MLRYFSYQNREVMIFLTDSYHPNLKNMLVFCERYIYGMNDSDTSVTVDKLAQKVLATQKWYVNFTVIHIAKIQFWNSFN